MLLLKCYIKYKAYIYYENINIYVFKINILTISLINLSNIIINLLYNLNNFLI